MRKTLIAIAVGAVLTVSACSSGHGTSGASDTKAAATATASAPQPTGQSSSTQGSSESCPTAGDFDAAVRSPQANLGGLTSSKIDSSVSCDDWMAATWMKLEQGQKKGRSLVVLRKDGSSGKWGILTWGSTFSNESSVCTGPAGVVGWLRQQVDSQGRHVCDYSILPTN